MEDSLLTLFTKVREWGRDKNINDARSQFARTVEEVGEIATELNRDRLNSLAMEDALGDSLVTLIIFADIVGYNLEDCLEIAYNEIKNRKGKTVHGSFIKETDL